MGTARQHPEEDLLSAYLDGETSPAETEAVRRHALACEPCAGRLASFRELDHALGAASSFDCETVRPLVSAELDGELDGDLAHGIREHLAACAHCLAFRTSARQVDLRLRELGVASPSRRVDDVIAAMVQPAPRARRVPAPALGAGLLRVATAVLIVTLGLSGSVLLTRVPEDRADVPRGAVVAAAQMTVLDGRTNTLYVLQPRAGLVMARDALTDRAIAQVSVGGTPSALALDEKAGALYVLDAANKTVTQIDTSTRTVVRSDALAVSGTPTSLNVDGENGKLLVASSAAGSGGEVAVIDTTSRRVETVRAVDVRPSLLVIDASADRMYVLGQDSTVVLETTTYERVAVLPGGGVAAASNGRGVTAILASAGDGARVLLHGARAEAIELEGRPLAIIAGPDDAFAVLVEVGATDRIVLVNATGRVASRDVDAAARHLAFDETSRQFIVVAEGGAALGVVASGSFAQAPSSAQPSPTSSPSSAPSATPTPAPSDPPPAIAARPTARPVPGLEIPVGARALWSGAYYIDLPGAAAPRVLAGRGNTLWYVDDDGVVSAFDTRTGGRTLLARLPAGARVSYLAVGSSALFALDPNAERLYAIDIALGRVTSITMPFGASVVSMDASPNGHLWFASSVIGELIEFDPDAAQPFRLVKRHGADRISAIYARVPNKVWFAFPSGASDAVVGAYDTRWGTVDEQRLRDVGPVDALFSDSSGTLWVSTSRAGLVPLRGDSLGRAASPGGSSYQAFAHSPEGVAWTLRVDEGGARLGPVGEPSTPFPVSARGLFVDDRGRAWTLDPVNRGLYLITRVTAP